MNPIHSIKMIPINDVNNTSVDKKILDKYNTIFKNYGDNCYKNYGEKESFRLEFNSNEYKNLNELIDSMVANFTYKNNPEFDEIKYELIENIFLDYADLNMLLQHMNYDTCVEITPDLNLNIYNNCNKFSKNMALFPIYRTLILFSHIMKMPLIDFAKNWNFDLAESCFVNGNFNKNILINYMFDISKISKKHAEKYIKTLCVENKYALSTPVVYSGNRIIKNIEAILSVGDFIADFHFYIGLLEIYKNKLKFCIDLNEKNFCIDFDYDLSKSNPEINISINDKEDLFKKIRESPTINANENYVNKYINILDENSKIHKLKSDNSFSQIIADLDRYFLETASLLCNVENMFKI